MRWILLTVALSTGAANAQEAASFGQAWSAVGPKTVAGGQNALEFAVGWPGVSVGWLHGLSSRFNLGVRAGFVYGVEGLVGTPIAPGIKLQLLTKVSLLESGRVSVGLTFEPGPLFHFYGGGTGVGFALPIGLRLGIAASSAVQLAVLFELPFWISFGTRSSFNIPILTGLGVEYFIQSSLLLFLRVKVGPTLFLRDGSAQLTLESVVGVAWRL